MKRSIKRKIACAGAAGVAGIVGVTQQIQAAPVSINSPSFTYSQNFDSLASTTGTANASAAWTNSTTLAGWVAFQSLPGSTVVVGGRDTPGTAGYNAVTVYQAGNGSSNAGALYSFGTAGSSERALGSVGSGTPGDFFYGVEFTNDTANTINSVQVSYRGEQWRQASNTSSGQTNPLLFDYSTTATSYSDNASFTGVAALDFVSPQGSPTSGGGAIDGNAAGNFTNIGPVTINSLNLAPGGTLRLRWFDDNDQGNDHGLSIDDFSFGVLGGGTTPEPGSLGAAAILGIGMLCRRRK